jgi:NADPH:quinone reductase-like Zn-dependent oxidoreductase
VFETGARLPERVDVVLETVGEATWAHSLRALKPGGTIVVAGATSGAAPPADLNRVFFLQLSVVGTTVGTRPELAQLIQMLVTTGIRPLIHARHALADARDGFRALIDGDVFGKIVVTI